MVTFNENDIPCCQNLSQRNLKIWRFQGTRTNIFFYFLSTISLQILKCRDLCYRKKVQKGIFVSKQAKSKIITVINMFITVFFYFQFFYNQIIIHIKKIFFNLSSFTNTHQSIYSSHFWQVKDLLFISHPIFHLSPLLSSF